MTRWLTAVFLLWLGLFTFPVLSESLAATLDGSWAYGLNMAHAQHLLFGTETSFTYGPLAYLSFPDPDLLSPVPVWLYWMGVSVVFWYAAARCLQLLPSRFTGILVCTALAGMLVFSETYTERMQAALVALIIAILLNPRTAPLAEFILAALIAAFSLLTKTNDGVIALLLYYSAFAWEVLTRRADWHERSRRWAVMLVTPLVFVLLLFAAEERTLRNLPAYLFNSLRIAAGYSEAMAIVGPEWQLALGLLSIVVLLLVIPRVADDAPSWRAGLVPAAVLAFFLFKHAFVRQDSHADTFHMKMAAAATPLLALTSTWRDRRLLQWFVAANMLLGIVISQNVGPRLWNYWTDQAISPSVMAAKVHDMLVFSRNWERLRQGNHYNLAGLVLPDPLRVPVGSATADSVPHDLDYVRANHWRWNPRPVLQAYTAYTAALDQMNARHLAAGSEAPEFVLMRWDAIDGRHPFLDDAASWRAVLNYYDIGVKGSNELLLTRRRGPRYTEPRPLGHVTAHWGDTLAVPRVKPGEFALMRVRIPRTLWGYVRGVLFRVDPIHVNALYASGLSLRYRATRANLVNGALVSHLPHEFPRVMPYFGELASGLSDQVESLRFETEGPRQFGSSIEIDWEAIALKPHEESPAAVMERPRLAWTAIWRPGQPGLTAVNASTTIAGNTLAIRPQTKDPQLLFQLPTDLSRFRTLLIRARYSVADLVNVFFSKQIDGRSFDATVPVRDAWLDCLLNTSVNPYWKTEGGTFLRFDPATDRAPGSVVELQGIWGSADSPFTGSQQMAFYPADPRDPGSPSAPPPAP